MSENGAAPSKMASPLRNILVVAVCVLPLCVSLSSIGDGFGQSEEGVNAAVWGVAARNIRDHGWIASRFGAVVRPLMPATDGIYAHHPPLPVWIARVWLVFGEREAIPRLFALLLAAATLALLFHALCGYVPRTTALWAIAVTASTVYMLRYGRLLTTLTVVTPLYVAALTVVLRRVQFGQSWRYSLFVWIPLLVASSWDGVAGAGALCTVLAVHELTTARRTRATTPDLMRALLLLAVALLSLGLLGLYFLNAQGSLLELLHQAIIRTGAGQLDTAWWLRGQFRMLRLGLGLFNVALLSYVVIRGLVSRRSSPLLGAILLAAVPSVAMMLGMREGAHNHWFWAYNLVIPLAFAVAQALTWSAAHQAQTQALKAMFLLQAAVNLANAGRILDRDRRLNVLGAFIKSHYRERPKARVAIYWPYDFHPYIAWYLGVSHDVVRSKRELQMRLRSDRWRADEEVLVETAHLGCVPSAVVAAAGDNRWIIARAADVAAACERTGE